MAHPRGRLPESTLTVSFAMLLNLVSASAAENKEHLWGFIRRHAPDTTPETHPDLDAAADFATRYFNDHVKPTRQFRAATEVERKAILDLRSRLAAWDGEADPEALQSLTFAVGKSHNFEPLRDWFKALYEVLLEPATVRGSVDSSPSTAWMKPLRLLMKRLTRKIAILSSKP